MSKLRKFDGKSYYSADWFYRVKLPAPYSFNRAEDAELIGYFHLARTALAPSDANKRYNRLVWSAMQFNRKHPKVSRTRAYIRVDNLTRL